MREDGALGNARGSEIVLDVNVIIWLQKEPLVWFCKLKVLITVTSMSFNIVYVRSVKQ